MLDIEELKLFSQYVLEHQIDFNKQEAIVKEGHAWCSDWWTIEVTNALCYEDYLTRTSLFVEHNTLCSKQTIIVNAEKKQSMLKNLEQHKKFSSTLLICEVGRGMDIILANSIKTWKKIICYDNNEFIVEKVKQYFSDLPLTVEYTSSERFRFQDVQEPTIVIANFTHVNQQMLLNTKNFLSIVDGNLLI